MKPLPIIAVLAVCAIAFTMGLVGIFSPSAPLVSARPSLPRLERPGPVALAAIENLAAWEGRTGTTDPDETPEATPRPREKPGAVRAPLDIAPMLQAQVSAVVDGPTGATLHVREGARRIALQEGDRFGEWRVMRIERDAAVLARGTQQRRVELYPAGGVGR